MRLLGRVLKVVSEISTKLLVAKDITKSYPPNVTAVNHISLSVGRGDFLFITGKSGAGKTTLIRLLSKQEEPDSGKLFIAGKDITAIPKSKGYLVRRELGVVFQDFKLIDYKTVFENVSFALEMLGYPDSYISKKTYEVLSIVGLKDKVRLFPKELSGGEQQRVAIARAVVNNPIILFADEPTGNLDWKTSFELMDLFMAINKIGSTIVMATHNEDIVKKLKKRNLVIEKGKKVDEIFY